MVDVTGSPDAIAMQIKVFQNPIAWRTNQSCKLKEQSSAFLSSPSHLGENIREDDGARLPEDTHASQGAAGHAPDIDVS